MSKKLSSQDKVALRAMHLWFSFLHRKNLYDKWMANAKNEGLLQLIAGTNWYTISPFNTDANAIAVVANHTCFQGFSWFKSKEGLEFWKNVNAEFDLELKNK